MRTLLSPSRAMVFHRHTRAVNANYFNDLNAYNGGTANQLNVTANVDKNPVIAGESLQLTIVVLTSPWARNALTIPSDLGRFSTAEYKLSAVDEYD